MTGVRLVGTSHVSDASAARARRAIREEEPDVVAVELCPRRYDDQIDPPSVLGKLVGRASELSWHAFAVEAALTLYQWKKRRDRLDGDHDMRAAIEAAARQGVPVALVDDPVTETSEALSRALWSDLRRMCRRPRQSYRTASEFRDRAEGLTSDADTDVDAGGGGGGGGSGDLAAALESASPSELDRLLRPVADLFPRSYDVLVERRNGTIAGRLRALSGDGTTVVGVVGRAHLPGVGRLLDDPEGIPAGAVDDPPRRDPAADVEVTAP